MKKVDRPIDYYRDEVRSGFLVTTPIKQAWAEALSILEEIDRICGKYNIKYFADWGTILGAVRHGGFVPWDDDLDICMLRPDYKRFREVVDDELPEGYVIHDYERKDDHWMFLIRVVNNDKMCFTPEYLQAHNNFPWLVGVDIFIKDYLYEDPKQEEARDRDVMRLIATGDIAAEKDDYDKAVELYRQAEKRMSEVDATQSTKVGQIFPFVLKEGLNVAEDSSIYDEVIRLPFEDTTIPVPATYNQVLTHRYGNYCEIHKTWDGHEYPFFDTQKQEMEEIAGQVIPEFTFTRDMLVRPDVDRSESVKVTVLECMAELKRLTLEAQSQLQDKAYQDYVDAINTAQQLAADLGSLIEAVRGEDDAHTLAVVEVIQAYCDALWEEYQSLEQGMELADLHKSLSSLDKLSASFDEHIINRREVLLLPVGPTEWQALQPVYGKCVADPNTDIVVVPLPYYKKDIYGTVSIPDNPDDDQSYLSGYPEDISYMPWHAYDVVLHCPDEVYIVSPYDGANACLSVPPDYYSSRTRQYTEQITYIVPFTVTEFTAEDAADQYNLRQLVDTPGVVYADKVIVQSENMKEQFVNALVTFAGEDTKAVWQDKIAVMSF